MGNRLSDNYGEEHVTINAHDVHRVVVQDKQYVFIGFLSTDIASPF